MKKIFAHQEGVVKKVLIIAVSVVFVLGTALITYVQAASQPPSSPWIVIWDEDGDFDKLVVKLKIHRYSLHSKFAIFHYLLSIQNLYDEDILVHSISAEAWSGPKNGPTQSYMYGKDTKTDILIPALETKVIRLNHKAENYTHLLEDEDVYAYAYIDWTHGAHHYEKAWFGTIDALYYWRQLFPNGI